METVVIIAILFYVLLAAFGSKNNIVFTEIDPNSLRIVKTGGNYTFPHNVDGYDYDREGRFIKANRMKGPLEISLGVRWIGLIWPLSRVATIEHWIWVSRRASKDNKTYVMQYSDKPVSSFKRSYTYGFVVPEAEIEGDKRARVEGTVTLGILIPRDAFTRDQQYLEVMMPRFEAAVSYGVREMTFDELQDLQNISAQLEQKDGSQGQVPSGTSLHTFLEYLKSGNGVDIGPDGDPDYDTLVEGADNHINRIGVVVEAATIQNVSLADEEGKAVRAKNLAKLNGEAAIEKAEQEAIAAHKRADGEYYVVTRAAEAAATALASKTVAQEERIQRLKEKLTEEQVAQIIMIESLPEGIQAIGPAMLGLEGRR